MSHECDQKYRIERMEKDLSQHIAESVPARDNIQKLLTRTELLENRWRDADSRITEHRRDFEKKIFESESRVIVEIGKLNSRLFGDGTERNPGLISNIEKNTEFRKAFHKEGTFAKHEVIRFVLSIAGGVAIAIIISYLK